LDTPPRAISILEADPPRTPTHGSGGPARFRTARTPGPRAKPRFGPRARSRE